jgi:hypothetical protein
MAKFVAMRALLPLCPPNPHRGEIFEAIMHRDQSRFPIIIVAAVMMVAFSGAQADVPPGSEGRSQRELEFRWSLARLAAYSPDVCGPIYEREQDLKRADIETRLFDQAADIVADGLNAGSPPGSPQERAIAILKQLEKISIETNAFWPEESRFHFQVLDLSPAVLVKMTVRSRESFFVFGVSEEKSTGKPNGTWRRVGSDDATVNHDSAIGLELYLLRRSPSGKARFLAKFDFSGCAGPTGVAYYAYEWNPQDPYGLELIIKQTGVFGLDDKVPGFPQIGALRTEGAQITLPYCLFSPIDTWDNPSLCAVDTYEIAGNSVQLLSRTYNRPDLVPVAKSVEYAEQKDLGAVLGYCISTQVARSMIRDMPPFVFTDELRVTPSGTGKEHVEMGNSPAYRFDVEKRNDRWVVAAFKAD